MLELRRITKLYGTVIGVNDITASLPHGAYGLLGPNGSGKSTLLNLITGQLRPSIGTVRTFGQPPWNNTRLRRRIGVCPEHDPAYNNVSARDWITYLLRLGGFSRREARRRAERALEEAGLGSAMSRPIGSYSRGMRQRAKLAQAFAHDPDLLILDEPFNGLDPVGRHHMTELLRVWIKSGKGLLLASHILHEVEAITPAFLLICGGRLLASGSADEVHSLLADIPNEIHIRCTDARALAERLLRLVEVEAFRFTDEGQGLVIATRSSAEVFRRLPEAIASASVRVDELHCSDESLQALFTSLLRIHRGKS